MEDQEIAPSKEPSSQNNKKNLLKRIGIAGFLFFLIKGIAWLFVFYYGIKFTGCK